MVLLQYHVGLHHVSGDSMVPFAQCRRALGVALLLQCPAP